MRSLTYNLVDVLRIEAGEQRLEIVPSRPLPLADAVRAPMQHCADTNGLVALEPDVPDVLQAQVLGDRLRSKQMLIDLMRNAVRLTPPGSVGLGVRQLACNGGLVSLHIEGWIGVSASRPSNRPAVYPGRQIHHAALRRHGTGPVDRAALGGHDRLATRAAEPARQGQHVQRNADTGVAKTLSPSTPSSTRWRCSTRMTRPPGAAARPAQLGCLRRSHQATHFTGPLSCPRSRTCLSLSPQQGREAPRSAASRSAAWRAR